MTTATITLTTAGTGTGPFDLYSDFDGYVTPFETGVSKSALVSGYTTSLVYNGTTIIRVQSNSIGCTNYVDLPVSGITTTTTTSTTTSTTTTTTAPVYSYAGTIVNNTGNTITAGNAIVKVNGSWVAYLSTISIASGATLTFSTSYTSPLLGPGNNFTLELYSYTGVTTSDSMYQNGGSCITSVDNFANMGTYLTATSTTSGSGSCAVYVIAMTIA
jgi:uncharacterized Zn-binding protein involved in type VI secretion